MVTDCEHPTFRDAWKLNEVFDTNFEKLETLREYSHKGD